MNPLLPTPGSTSSLGSQSADAPVLQSVTERFRATTTGGILYDPGCVNDPADALFEPAYWRALGALESIAGGRGSIAIIRPQAQGGDGPRGRISQAPGQTLDQAPKWVLRHYRRGGLAARLSEDRYVWLGAGRTRSFAEWRLLARLRGLGLPVPHPIAARYVRGSFAYRADLITAWLPCTRTLADVITGAELPAEQWRRVGRTIACFHCRGVQHPDLNANNILLQGYVDEDAGHPAQEGDAPVYLLDFDRGRIRERGAWEAHVLARLQRSLRKIGRLRTHLSFSQADWKALTEGYEEELARAAGAVPVTPGHGPLR